MTNKDIIDIPESDAVSYAGKDARGPGKDEDGKLVRLEIIMSQSMEDDFIAAFTKADTGKMFTKIPQAMGQGFSVPKMGDAIWPQLNCIYIVFCTKTQYAEVRKIIHRLRKEYPGEGLACFRSKAKMV
ncbi:PG0541 family transporter-associated protein [Treponema brennaborense]|uniref:Uncharacterized protein n=1 Tax=Treponema brennaborense (strain DSM 12168 / CIP 105900 / DD5/3) TaxID=906968 RepID=F4LLX7_TREBD|nr:PG0541 family transporter-associated protein [Treponema brennaborense]AEE15669.1 hypothetical protein Trebr_0219 [Treponema brennaborense DSM 12168]